MPHALYEFVHFGIMLLVVFFVFGASLAARFWCRFDSIYVSPNSLEITKRNNKEKKSQAVILISHDKTGTILVVYFFFLFTPSRSKRCIRRLHQKKKAKNGSVSFDDDV